MSQSLFLNIQYEYLTKNHFLQCILYFFTSAAKVIVVTWYKLMSVPWTWSLLVNQFHDFYKMSSCVFLRSGVENEKKLCKEQKTGQYCWVSYQICRNHFDWYSIGTNYRFCLLYLTVMTYKFAYHIMLIQCFIAKKVVINIISRYGLALASPPTFMHERGI